MVKNPLDFSKYRWNLAGLIFGNRRFPPSDKTAKIRTKIGPAEFLNTGSLWGFLSLTGFAYLRVLLFQTGTRDRTKQ
jgi:hypothetical protein